jgi:hypothetical protein
LDSWEEDQDLWLLLYQNGKMSAPCIAGSLPWGSVAAEGGSDNAQGTRAAPYGTLAKALTRVKDDYATIAITGTLEIEPNTITIDSAYPPLTLRHYGDAGTLKLKSQGSLITVKDGGKLTLGGGLELVGISKNNGGSDNTASLVKVEAGGEFTMSGGEIRGNSQGEATKGGGVYVAAQGKFTMSGGEISGNSLGNKTLGGGVYVVGTFVMSGGEIRNNTAGSNGGGVCVYDGGEFTMSGGEIRNNTAGSMGGGVFVRDGKFTMSDGVIGGNTSSQVGGGVGIHVTTEVFTKTGGIIYGNDASSDDDKNTNNNVSGTATSMMGHAVAVNDGGLHQRNATADKDVNLSYDGKNYPKVRGPGWDGGEYNPNP